MQRRTRPPPAPRPGGRSGPCAGADRAAAGRRVEGDDVVVSARERAVGRDRGPGGDRHAVLGARPATISSRPSRRRSTSATATSTRRRCVNRSPATPAKPSRRRSTGSRPPRRRRRARSSRCWARRSCSQNVPCSPSTRSSPRRVGHSARRIVRGSTTPFQRLRSSRSAMSWLRSAAGASALGGEPKATPRERAPPAVTSVKRACSPSSPHRGHAAGSAPRAPAAWAAGCPCRTAAGARAPRPGRGPSTPPGTTASTRSTDDQVRGRQRRAGVRGERAPERLDRVGVELHAGGHAVAAEAGQVLGAGRQPVVQVVGRDAAARAAARRRRSSRAITTHGRRQRSTRREATMPTTPGCQPSPGHDHRALGGLRRAGRLGREQDARLGALAVAR